MVDTSQFYKNLGDTPARPQQIMMHLQPYDFWLGSTGQEKRWYSQIHYPDTIHDQDLRYHWILQSTIPDWQLHKSAFQDAISGDWEMKALAKMITDGWPEETFEVPKNLQKNFTHASTLTVEDGLILKVEALLVPDSKQEHVLRQLYDGHQGITKTNLQAKNVVYWPGMTRDIEQMINSCTTCHQFQAKQCNTSLEKCPTPDHPWQTLASDLLDFDGGSAWLWQTCTQRCAS